MNNISKYRGLKEISQKEFAEMLGMTRPGLSYVENGNAKNVCEERLKKMSEILGVSEVKLLGFENFKYLPQTQDDIDYLIEILQERRKGLS